MWIFPPCLARPSAGPLRYRYWSAPVFSSFLCCTPVARSLMTKCLSEGLTRSDLWITLGPGTRLPEVTAQGCSKNGKVETCDRVGSSRVSFRFSFREMTRVISRSSAQGPSGPERAREAHTSLRISLGTVLRSNHLTPGERPQGQSPSWSTRP